MTPTQKVERELIRLWKIVYAPDAVETIGDLKRGNRYFKGWLRLARESLRRKAVLAKVYNQYGEDELWNNLHPDEIRRAMK